MIEGVGAVGSKSSKTLAWHFASDAAPVPSTHSTSTRYIVVNIFSHSNCHIHVICFMILYHVLVDNWISA